MMIYNPILHEELANKNTQWDSRIKFMSTYIPPKKPIKSIFKKTDTINLLNDISSILDPDDTEIIVVRGKGCEMLFTNAKAEARMRSVEGYASGCKTGYAKHYPNLCAYCPYGGKGRETDIAP